ncbi:GNAT family N-acetyltransferase [Bacillus sp. FJAT-49736]|uniref:GNAT family N-acetyltransferase n=1 Tax=Bacillus sp. FJAT-49736 TaxID=2833582 RepID=UPI001BC915E8|nr:GNAT family N-acetyltransferase [Bacillus sp. FJAT-49736]MBS4172703.1 GNAT family N-acetyltransferase [Bacillus sp. FJAT-49736]
MNIRILKENDAPIYQDLRLKGLKNNPEAFGSTYERESAFTLQMIEERIKPSEDKFVLGAFNPSDLLVGIVTFMRETSLKTSHKGNIFGMFVASEVRGQGVGRLLLLDLIERARNFDGMEQLNLTVVSNNTAAKKLYSSLGFTVYGVERNALKFDGEYFDEDLMVLFL